MQIEAFTAGPTCLVERDELTKVRACRRFGTEALGIECRGQCPHRQIEATGFLVVDTALDRDIEQGTIHRFQRIGENGLRNQN